MGRSERRTLRYALLSTRGSSRSELWTTGAAQSVGEAEFDRQVAAVCELARELSGKNKRRDGARSIAATKDRIEARDERAAHRTALDLQRLRDLEDRYAQRRAVALRQKWFVIGRVIEAAMKHDPHLRAAVFDLLRSAKLRRDERVCLDLVGD